MMKDAIRALETGALAEIGLIAFVVAFALILVWTFSLSARFRDAAKSMPLNDSEPLPTETNHA